MVGIEGVCGILEQVGSVQQAPEVINQNNNTLGTSRNTHLGSFGLLEAARGQTKQTMVGTKVEYGILEQVGSVQRPQR